MKKEEIEKLKKDLEEKIANRQSMIIAYGDRMPEEKFEELDNWKKQLAELNMPSQSMNEEEKKFDEKKTEEDNDNQGVNDEEKEEKQDENDNTENETTLENEDENDIDTEKENEDEENIEPENEDESSDNSQKDEDLEEGELEENPLNITINKKTGEVNIDDGKINETFMMSSSAYKRKNLVNFHENMANIINISNEDRKYMKNVDPTIAKAYFFYDGLTRRKGDNSLLDEYVKTVISRSKAIKNKEEYDYNSNLGDITIDIGWHPNQKNMIEDKKEKFGLKRIIQSFRANHILKKHGMNKTFYGKKMDLATVIDNRKKFAGISSVLALLGTTAALGLSSGPSKKDYKQPTPIEENAEKQNNKKPDSEQKQEKKDKNTSQKNNSDTKTNNKTKNESKDTRKEEKKESSRFQFGDEVSIERYSLLYKSSTAKEASGALNTKERLGINKIACEINGEVYSTKDHSFDEIYKMAEKAGVKVSYHVDKMKTINGKNYVKVNDTYVCNENGTLKTQDGKVWKGDVEYSSVAGWIKQKDVEKVKQQRQTTQKSADDGYER